MHEGIVRLKLFFKVYPQEGFLMVASFLATLIGIVALGLAFQGASKPAQSQEVPAITTRDVDDTPSPTQPQRPAEKIAVDISGAVKKPQTYVLQKGARLSEALELAGGLAYNADTDYFYRNYNNARILVDQEKIYIPRTDETGSGVFIEDAYYIEQGTPTTVKNPPLAPTGSASSLLAINTATQAQIEDLPGIGPVSAEKIIQNRPYSSYEDLVARSGLTEAVIAKFQDQITYAQP